MLHIQKSVRYHKYIVLHLHTWFKQQFYQVIPPIYFSDTKHCSEGDIYAVVFPTRIANAPHHHYMKYKTASVLIELGPTIATA